MKFYLIIKELRETQELSQKELALRLKKTQSTISDWEKRRSEPSLQDIEDIANFFDVTTDFLLGREDDFGNVTISSGNVSGNGNTVNSHNVIGSRTAALSPSDSELLRKYHSAPANIQKAIKELLS
ncbi:helix-turn-helix domain-containing protein [Pumilibacter muris]|uniref:helix-turn-helix domain-containing protein n=1 Tax=Pumilibacter muris TaxID=2941510 RepID=UPI00203CF944|nr:helix-turn-helix domain-containing protein [Pumilibacter muris]